MGVRVASSSVRVLTRVTTMLEVVNTTTETTIFSYSLYGTVGPHAPLLGTDGTLRLTMLGSYRNNSGLALVTPHTFRLKFGGSTIVTDTGPLFLSSATWKPHRIESRLTNLGATDSQMAEWEVRVPDALQLLGIQAASLAVDTTSAQTLAVTFQHGQANANISFRLQHALLELA